MSRSTWLKLFALLAAFSLVAAACGDDDDDDGATGTDDTEQPSDDASTPSDDGGDSTETPSDDSADGTEPSDDTADGTDGGGASGLIAEAGLWDDGECDASLDPLKVGIVTVFSSPVLTLGDQAEALELSVDAFNARGGALGHCIEYHGCDDGADPNKALACVQELVDAGVAVTVNDTTSFGPADVSAAFAEAGIPRFAISPGQDDYADTNSYPFTAGGTGVSVMMPQGLLDQGVTKVAIVRVDAPAATQLGGFYQAIFADNGLEVVADLPVPGGTTDYSQFILAAQDAGAEGVALPIGGQEGIQVLRAGQQLDADLLYSSSLGTFPLGDIRSLGEYGTRVILNEGLPPAGADLPAIKVLVDDLSSGPDILQIDNLKASPMRSWIGLYALLALIRETGNEDFSAAGIKAMIDAAGPIDMLGMTPDWTPATDHEGAWLRTGNNYYAFWKYDPASDSFVKVSETTWDETICDSPVGGPCA